MQPQHRQLHADMPFKMAKRSFPPQNVTSSSAVPDATEMREEAFLALGYCRMAWMELERMASKRDNT